MSKRNVIAYLRVSTREQGVSGLGLEAQESAIRAFAASNNLNVVKVFTEVLSGKLGIDSRPQLCEALELGDKMNCSIVVAKLDRLSRSMEFIIDLMKRKVPFIVCNLGIDVDSFQLHIYAAMAEKERRDIGARTSSALQAKKAREPGWRAGLAGNGKAAVVSTMGVAARKAQAYEFALRNCAMIKSLRDGGLTYAAIAQQLNQSKVPTAKGGKWYDSTVRNSLALVVA